MNRVLRPVIFFIGLGALAWVGTGFVGANPLALVVTGLIAAFYLAGAFELRRFDQATSALARAVADLSAPPADLAAWLGELPASLRNAVRRRVQGEPVALPGPALTPYLTGLLVLLGMLGTFLGMVLTLRGTGLALDNATDMQAVRASLVAPVRGLGLAFGTSIAGVAASAALGLVSALCRRERGRAVQALDARIATTLRVHTVAHQRDESLRLQRQQADLMPALVESLRAMTDQIARQAEASHAQLRANQEAFHAKAEAAYAGLAAAVDRSLRESLAHSARIAGDTIRPVAEATLEGIARETGALRASLVETMHEQLEQLSTRFAASNDHAAAAWQAALARHEQASETLAADVRASHEAFAATFETRSSTLADAWQSALAGHEQAGRAAGDELRASQERLVASFAQRASALLDGITHQQAESQRANAQAIAGVVDQTSALQARIAETAAQQIGALGEHLDATTRRVTDTWTDALARHEQVSDRLAADTRASLTTSAAAFEQHAAALLRTVQQAHDDQQATAAARDEARAAAFTTSVEALAATLRTEWQHAGATALAQQQRASETMADTARAISAQAEAHAKSTTAEIATLLRAAAEAPRAAAEVIAELRDKLSDSTARDNALLDERARMLETLGTLLAAVQQAATEQRGAIDALVGSSAALLERVGERFGERLDAESAKLEAVAAQVTGGAAEVASLADSFGLAVQLFAESNDKLGAQLERIDGALSKSLARSDEQLAYYVAQAREVVDLSVMSHKQILEDLQRIAGRPIAEGATS